MTDLSPLFDAYRSFYGQERDVHGAHAFLAARIEHRESVILVAELDGTIVGFTQLYPSFTSVRMQKIYILNDLFVAAGARKTGVGAALLDAAKIFAGQQGAARLTLTTKKENLTAQSVYEANGWVRDTAFFTYTIEASA